MGAPKNANKKAVFLATATESRRLLPYVETLSLPASAKATVFAIGLRDNLEKLQAACPSSGGSSDLLALHDIAWTLGWQLVWGNIIPPGFSVCALGGSLEDARRAAKSLKLVARSGADFDVLTRSAEETAAFTWAADLADTHAAAKKLAAMSQAEREAQLLAVVRQIFGPEILRRLVQICGVAKVGFELPSRVMELLPANADVAPLAACEAALRKESTRKSKDDHYPIGPERYYEFVRRLAPLGGQFPQRASEAARVWLEGGVAMISEGALRAAADITGDREPVMRGFFQQWVWADQTDFMLFEPNLPGHVDPRDSPLFLPELGGFYTCVCAECNAHRMQLGTRRITALAPFDGLSAETQDLVRKVLRIKRCKPIVSVLEEWAPSLASTGRAPAAAKKKASQGPPTPHLDAAEAWLAKVLAAKTTAGLQRLAVELDAFDNFQLMDEDAERWQELSRSICDHRNTFPHGTKQHGILQEMNDILSST